MPMSTIQTTTGGREFDLNFGPGQLITALSELQMTALVASGMAVFVEGEATALPASGQIPITSVQFRYPASFGFEAVNARLFLFDGIEYAGDGSGLVRVTPLPEAPGGGVGGGDASATNQSTQITLAGTANTRLSEIDAAIDAIGAKIPASPSTAALQSEISNKLPALGQQTVAGSVSTALATEQAATLGSIAGISVPAHDYVALGYTGDNLTTVVYKTGGSGGTTVATLTLAYTGARLDSVTRS